MENYVCPVCGKDFEKRVYKKTHANYCSQECAYKGRSLGFSKRIVSKPYTCKRKEPKVCLICQKEFIYKSKKQKYCSRKCFEIAHKENMLGVKNPSYQNGNSYNKRSYRGNDWETLRKAIYKRDLYICQDCGVKCISKRDSGESDRIIQCHHIISYIENQNNADVNLITLCLQCHLKRHNN